MKAHNRLGFKGAQNPQSGRWVWAWFCSGFRGFLDVFGGLVPHAATRRFRPQVAPSLDPARSALLCLPYARARAGDAAGRPAAALWVARLGDFGLVGG